MADDRSLDDFAPGDADADTDGANDGGGAGDPSPDQSDDVDGVEPAVATSTWHADGAECERCGEQVERRWREGDAFVCADCASW